MKYFLLLFSLFSFLFAKDNTTYLRVDGMQCSYSCAGKVSNIVQNIKGVKDCSVDFSKGVATVVYDDQKLGSKDIISAVKVNSSYIASEMCDKSKASYLECNSTSEKKVQKI
jgi:copper chaperone CopZ